MNGQSEGAPFCRCSTPPEAHETHWSHSRARRDLGEPMDAVLWVQWCNYCGGVLRMAGIRHGEVYLDQGRPVYPPGWQAAS